MHVPSINHRRGKRAGARPGLDVCITLHYVCAHWRKTWENRRWTALDLASARYADPIRRGDVANKIRKQMTRRGLGDETTSAALAQAFCGKDQEHVERGRLGVALGRSLRKICAVRGRGPVMVGKEVVQAFNMMPLEDLSAVVQALKPFEGLDAASLEKRIAQSLAASDQGKPTIHGDALTLLQSAGAKLLQLWEKRFGRRMRIQAKGELATFPTSSKEESRRKAPDRAHPPQAAEAAPPAARTSNLVQLNEHAPMTGNDPPPAPGPSAVAVADRRGFPRLAKWLFAAMLCGFVLTAAAYVMVDPNFRAYQTLVHIGSQEALQLLEAQVKGRKPGDMEYHYLAFAQYRAGHLERARNMTLDLVADQPNSYVLSACYYLLGLIARDHGQTNFAVGYFDESLRLLNPQRPDGRTFLLFRELAKTYLEDDDAAQAEKYIQKAAGLVHLVRDSDLFEFWQTRGRLNMASGQLRLALADFQASEPYAANDDHRFNYHAEIGSAFFRLGEINNALIHIDHADKLVASERMRAHLNTIKIGIRHCFGQDYSMLERQVQNWLDQHPSQSLKRKLDHAKRCPEGLL